MLISPVMPANKQFSSKVQVKPNAGLVFSGRPKRTDKLLARLNQLNTQFVAPGSIGGFTLAGPCWNAYKGPVKDITGREFTISLLNQPYFVRHLEDGKGLELIRHDDKERYHFKITVPDQFSVEKCTWQLTAKIENVKKPIVVTDTMPNSLIIRSAYDLMMGSIVDGLNSLCRFPF